MQGCLCQFSGKGKQEWILPLKSMTSTDLSWHILHMNSYWYCIPFSHPTNQCTHSPTPFPATYLTMFLSTRTNIFVALFTPWYQQIK